MPGWSASAPAKLVVAGEYAVVWGSPAISAAVDVRARATAVDGAPGWSLCVVNSGWRSEFTPTDAARLQWPADPGADGALLQAAWRCLNPDGALTAVGPLAIELDSRAFYAASGVKRGLGSSAAVAVALTAVLERALGRRPSAASCVAVHREFQAQRGSGIDVVTSLRGGVVAKTGDTVTALRWPESLAVTAVWTGVPASTPRLLQRLEVFAEAQPQVFARARDALGTAAGEVLDAWRDASTQAIVESLYAFAEQLRHFDARCGIGIWSAEHTALERLADDYGLVYKPSGAGGGDYGLAFGTQAARVEDFRLAVAERGFTAADFDLCAPGLQVSDTDKFS